MITLINKKLGKYEKYALIVLIIAIIFRFSLIPIYTVSGDACLHLSASKFIGENAKIPLFEPIGRDEPFWAPPLFHIIASAFYLIFSPINGELGLKLVAPLFGSGTLVLSYLILKRFLNEKALFYSILFMSFIPIFIDYSILGYVESMLTFFVLLMIYFALNNRFFLSSIAAGLAILTKYNGLFVIPVLLFIAYKYCKSKQLFLRNALITVIVPIIISLPWFIRNWILLGNPIWPFLNFVFNGLENQSYSMLNFSYLFSTNTYIATYLGFFGIPDGNYKSLLLVNIPYLPILFSIFLIATIVFIIPLFFGFTQKSKISGELGKFKEISGFPETSFPRILKNKVFHDKKIKNFSIFHLLLLSYGILFILYIINVGPFVSRMLLPAIIALAFFYGIGLDSITKKCKKLGNLHLIIIILISTGFVFAEAAKFTIASGSWDFYQEDFNWVKSNTNKEDIFIVGSQCIPYHIDRTSLFPSALKTGNYDYIWVNQNFKLDKRSILSKEHLQEIESKNKELIYQNQKTSTKIYKITQ